MNIEIVDWFELHHGFTLNLNPGFTALVGPNGAGKTTLLHQIKKYAEMNGIDVWSYSNIVDGGDNARQAYLFHGDIKYLATAALSSEGEQVAMNFSLKVGELGATVRNAKQQGKPLFVLLDAIDSGASIDRARDLRNLFDLIYRNDIAHGAEVYIVMAVNHYELVKAPATCVNVRNGKTVAFNSYDEYADFICTFEEKYPRLAKEEFL